MIDIECASRIPPMNILTNINSNSSILVMNRPLKHLRLALCLSSRILKAISELLNIRYNVVPSNGASSLKS